MSVVLARQLSKCYHSETNPVRALDSVNFEVSSRERLSLVGRSGSGKTTLLNLLAGLDRPTSGELNVAGQNLGSLSSHDLAQYRRREIGVVFQSFQLLPNFSAVQNVELPLMLQGIGKSARFRMARKALERVGLADRMEHRPSQLSGGEQQRVAVARAVVHRPKLLLADEPTGNLDSRTAEQVMTLILEMVTETRAAMVLITHDRDLAERTADRTVKLLDGRIEGEAE